MIEDSSSSFDVCFTNRKGKKFWGFDAAKEFYGINDDQAFELFDPSAYDHGTRFEVADRLMAMADKV